MTQIITFLWLIYVPSAINMVYRVIKNRKSYMRNVDLQRQFQTPTIVFLIASRSCPEIVNASISKIHEVCKKIYFKKYAVKVVTDFMKSLPPSLNAEVISVPKTYTVQAKYKARSLQYALKSIPKRKDVWIFHLDEESMVNEQCVRSLLEHIEDDGSLIAEGAINYPYDIRNIFTLFLEGERATSCYHCVDQMRKNPLWLHGSNLLINSVIEHEIGWEFGDSLAEDQRFAYAAHQKFGNIFGWHGGLILEKPAFTIRDAIKQRKRWFAGNVQNLKHLTKKKQALQYYYLITWVSGFFSSILAPLSWFGIIHGIQPLLPLIIFALCFWLLQYQLGLYLNLRHLELGKFQRFKYHFLQLILCPVVGIFSTLPAFLALVNPPKKFDIIKKC